jgi:alcohol dehydrogenase class IV
MNIVTLLQPPRIVVGDGCAVQCAEYLAQRGIRRTLLVSSNPVLPTLGGLLKAMQQANVTVVAAAPVDCEPTCSMFEQMLAFARRQDISAVLGIGGGSVIDVAKLLAALTQGSQAVTEVFGINRLAGRALLLVCLPTTAGTGAEVSPNAILLDEADELKKGIVSPNLVPDAAYVDPMLTVSVPPPVTAATGLDALTHCIEAYANNFSHPAVDLYALQGIRLIAAHLERAFRNGQDLEARAALALGSLYGGLCLGPVNTGAVHALSYPLGGRFHVAHGVANALLLPHVLRFNAAVAPQRYAEVALALGLPPAADTVATAGRGVAFLAQLSRNCGVPQTLSEIKIPRTAIPAMAKAAMQVTRLLKNNLRPVTEADAVAIYEAAF